jgi:heme oxygenase (biliverdin-producing, ferredoxin)
MSIGLNVGSSSGSSRPLSERLRAETKDLHTAVERAGVMAALLRGALERERYTALLRNLHALYAALEAALTRHAGHAEVAPVVFPVLFRQAALAADLAVLHGPAWPTDLPLQRATQTYVARLQDIETRQPALLAAHAYVRYLGDLSGGQMLRQIVVRGFQLGDDDGSRFYDFGDAATVQTHLRAFRAGLASLGLGTAGNDALVAEARWAFGRHGELFVELAA